MMRNGSKRSVSAPVQPGDTGEDVLELLDMIERGFDDIEHRISNMDKEHSKYVHATVTRLNYLLSGERHEGTGYSAPEPDVEDDYEEVIQKTGEKMNLSLVEILSEKSLYKRRKKTERFCKSDGTGRRSG